MSPRIEVDPARPPVPIPRRTLNEIYAHAVESFPEECCGLVIGDESERFRDVTRCRNEMTRCHRQDPIRFPRDGRQGFYMNPLDSHKAQQEAEASGHSISAVYHSHVGVGAYFSETDLECVDDSLFPFPEADHIVVAVLEGRVREVGLFRRERSSGTFSGRSVDAVE